MDAVIVTSDITLSLGIVSVLGIIFLAAPERRFLCFTLPASVAGVFSGYKLPVLIPSYLQKRPLEVIAVIITRNNVFSFSCRLQPILLG